LIKFGTNTYEINTHYVVLMISQNLSSGVDTGRLFCSAQLADAEN